MHTCFNCAQAQSCFYCVNQLSPFAVYLVNLLSLTVNTPKKSSLLGPPLCSSNVRVCFHTMRSVSSQKHIFEIFAFHTFQTPAFSSPAFSVAPLGHQSNKRVFRKWIDYVTHTHTDNNKFRKLTQFRAILCNHHYPIHNSRDGLMDFYTSYRDFISVLSSGRSLQVAVITNGKSILTLINMHRYSCWRNKTFLACQGGHPIPAVVDRVMDLSAIFGPVCWFAPA